MREQARDRNRLEHILDKELHPSTPWRQIEGMRHHIVHGYAQIRKDMLWNVVQEDLLPLKSQIKKIISETNWDEWEHSK